MNATTITPNGNGTANTGENSNGSGNGNSKASMVRCWSAAAGSREFRPH